MAGQSFMEEIDCASFFDHIDDLIEFPPVNDTIPVDCNEFSNIWANNSDDLQVSDPIFCGGNSDNASDLSAELHVPYEDIVQLEWLSNFVEDSFSGDGLTIKKEDVPVEKDVLVGPHQFQTASPVSVLESSSSSSSSTSYSGSGTIGSKMIPLSPIQRGPQRARTKRPRPTTFNPRDMVDLLSPLVLVPVSGCSETEKNFTSCHGPNSVSRDPDQKKKKKIKKPKIQEENENQNENQNPPGQGVRKCLHCEITKTPQWRAGPMGPKTLCNACGVRYKSGRLFPEYRPAASPTFVPTLHSNSHKKVVEMRTKFGPNDKMVPVKSETEPELIPNINPQAD
ncbi:putative transcription factor C2C2-GATA family [Helianthus annuus]|uniref:GATA transcription factor n=2 Tax=Helianthus annuus TaxID=4232 RepID=A0A9K3NBY6_HELAN|nr:GATA transcription factor 8 [Helianthus annuus]KAF5794631.1 putative transcription factor C2C2-GATA family [Helianthus annuus]KAJ0538245.1 putative transcription factor C2C2-GATA family [Helianthus annuus]KAJ0718551.1 putative transcription factor C2C2-GATA family [Helianthus annuus]KAJ0900926.1 putative transcription factor C2C2-GATA family [Helianthus annuus]